MKYKWQDPTSKYHTIFTSIFITIPVLNVLFDTSYVQINNCKESTLPNYLLSINPAEVS